MHYKRILSAILCCVALCLYADGCINGKIAEKKEDKKIKEVSAVSVLDSQRIDIKSLVEKEYAIAQKEYTDEMERLKPEIEKAKQLKKNNPKKVPIHFPKLPRKPNSNMYDVYPEALTRTPAKRLPSDEKAWGGRNLMQMKYPVHFYNAGEYTLWIRNFRTKDKYDNLIISLLDQNTETTQFLRVDFSAGNTATPETGEKFKRDGNRFVWTSVKLNVERPGDYHFTIVPQSGRGYGHGIFALSDLYVSNDSTFDPKNPKLTKLQQDIYVTPEGWQPARHIQQSTDLNTSIRDRQKQLLAGFHSCYPSFHDPNYLVQLGAIDSDGPQELKKNVKMQTQWGPEFSIKNTDFAKKYPIKGENPKDRKSKVIDSPWAQAGTNGEYWGTYSYAFEPYRKACYESAVKSMKELLNSPKNDSVDMMWTAWEVCGNYDYGDASVKRYRKFLEQLYGNIGEINKVWHTEYKKIDEIVPAKFADCIGKNKIEDPFKRAQTTANFIDFRDYCSKTYASFIGLKTKAIVENDPLKRRIMSNLSANNISSVSWMQWRPLSYEDTCLLTNKGATYVGYDNYGVDDLFGANYELYDTFSDGKQKPILREGSIHASDPVLMARSLWTLIGKGMHGFRAFTTHETGTGELQKFGFMDMFDHASPRPKLAAISDTFRAMHHLDYLLSDAKRIRTSKPVAIYYSAICNTLQERPASSIFDPAPDNFLRVYEILRGNGYPVTFITDRQICDGKKLNEVQAVFFIDAKYIPTEVVTKVQNWVKNGGHILCDAQPGIYDGHGFPANRMASFLGIEPIKRKKVDASAAEKLTFGYSAYSFDVIDHDELYKTACEWKNQYDSKHPISKKVGKLMFSGYGVQNIKMTDGESLISQNNGGPAWIIRNHGEKGGTSSYFGGFLGTIYGAGCTNYEWRDNHADPSPYRFMDAYMDYIGAKKNAVSDLEHANIQSLRFESPLVDTKGNAVLSMISYNFRKLPDFETKYRLPAEVKTPKIVLALTNGNRTVKSLPFQYDAKKRVLSFKMPGFTAFGNVLVLNDYKPVVSVEWKDAPRDAYHLADVRPSGELTATVRVFNPSGKTLAPGRVTLRLTDGWFYDKETVNVKKIPAYTTSEKYTFKIKAPAVNAARRLRPINFIYESGSEISSPAVEMVWFQKEPLNQKMIQADLD